MPLIFQSVMPFNLFKSFQSLKHFRTIKSEQLSFWYPGRGFEVKTFANEFNWSIAEDYFWLFTTSLLALTFCSVRSTLFNSSITEDRTLGSSNDA